MIAIIDYGMGNICSLGNALGRLEAEWTLTSDPEVINSATHVILPGVGNAAEAMHNLRSRRLPEVIWRLRCPAGSPSNSHTPEDAKLNELIDATNASPKMEEQIAAFKELSKYENESMFTMALYYQPIFLITSDRIGDIKKANPQFNYDWDIQNWTVG